jgi:hypothetical protein
MPQYGRDLILERKSIKAALAMSAFNLGLMQNNKNRYQNVIESLLLLISAFIILHKPSNSKNMI